MSSPEAIRKAINSIPEGIDLMPMDETEFINDEDDKIQNLLDQHKITIKEYNKIMKHKHQSQLNITGLSNISEINISENDDFNKQKQDNTVLFGNNFANNSKMSSEASMMKVKKDTTEDTAPSRGSQFKQNYELKPGFSMSKQVEEFKKQLEKDHEEMKVQKDTSPTSPFMIPIREESRLSQISDFLGSSTKHAESFKDVPERDNG